MNLNIGILRFLKLISSFAIIARFIGSLTYRAMQQLFYRLKWNLKCTEFPSCEKSEILWKLSSNRTTNPRYKKLTPFSSVSGDRISWVGRLVSPFRVCFVGDIPSANPLTALSTGLAPPLLPVADDVLSLLALAAPRKSINSLLSCCLVCLCRVAFFMARYLQSVPFHKSVKEQPVFRIWGTIQNIN